MYSIDFSYNFLFHYYFYIVCCLVKIIDFKDNRVIYINDALMLESNNNIVTINRVINNSHINNRCKKRFSGYSSKQIKPDFSFDVSPYGIENKSKRTVQRNEIS